MTDAEKKELEALKGKTNLTDEEKVRLAALESKVKDGGQTFTEDYVRALRQEAAKYRTKAKENEEALAKYATIDIDEYDALKKEKVKADEKKLEEKGEFAKLKEQLIEQHNKELATKETEKGVIAQRAQQLETELNRTILSYEISVAATVAKAINPRLVEMVALQQMKVEQLEDGKRVIRVLDGEGKPRTDIKTGEPVKVSQLLEEMKLTEDYAHLFSGGNAGAGSQTTLFDGKRIVNPWKKDSFNLSMQGKIVTENPELANRLKIEAGVK